MKTSPTSFGVTVRCWSRFNVNFNANFNIVFLRQLTGASGGE